MYTYFLYHSLSPGGRVNLSSVPGVPEELKEVVMTPTQDDFYAKVCHTSDVSCHFD